MSAKTLKRLDAETTLQAAILEEIKRSGLSEDAVKAILSRLIDVIDEEA